MSIYSDAASFGVGFVGAAPVGGGDPIYFGMASGVSLNFTQNLEPLRGDLKYPIAHGIKDCDIKGKIDTMSIFGGSVAQLLGGTSAAGQEILIPDEAATIPTTPFQVTVAKAATFANSYRVFSVTNQIHMVEVDDSPATGEFSVTADGVYTFAADDAGDSVLITYTYTESAEGLTSSTTNTRQIVAPAYRLVCASGNTTQAGMIYLVLPKVVFGNFGLEIKTGSWASNNVEFTAQADYGESICSISTTI